ncbi:MAG: class I SAM-dependent methyltransferase [Burkholderiales bacterium]
MIDKTFKMFSKIMSRFASRVLGCIPYVRELEKQHVALKAEIARWKTWQLPGHFYSPVPSLPEITRDAGMIFRNTSPPLSEVGLNPNRQHELLNLFATYHHQLPDQWNREGHARYCYHNEYYSWADGIVLFCMLRHISPRRLVEIGSGYSSAVVLDTDEKFLGMSLQSTFIDPYPERLLGLLRNDDKSRVRLIEQRVQDVGVEVFTDLQAGDILLVDSSHVSKTGSDVNRTYFEILPALAPGVYIHFHDIFYPFEYPEGWVREGVAWNEAYLLHAFMQYNNAFSIQFFTSYLIHSQPRLFASCLPLAMNSERSNPGIRDSPGSSLWLRRN